MHGTFSGTYMQSTGTCIGAGTMGHVPLHFLKWQGTGAHVFAGVQIDFFTILDTR